MNAYQEAMLIEAIRYAHRGWHVLPCDRNGRPRTANGLYDATVREERIIRWWEEDPQALIGIRTGEESGFWVVDVDMTNGRDGLAALTDHFRSGFDLDLEKNLWQKTATDGFHFCFKYDDDRPIGCGCDFLPGVDVRGDGGYILAAPSSMKVGNEWKQFKWKDANAEPQEAPAWAYELQLLRQEMTERPNFNAVMS